MRKAGAAKREELLEYLSTLAGEALAARVAKLLVHAERQEVGYEGTRTNMGVVSLKVHSSSI